MVVSDIFPESSVIPLAFSAPPVVGRIDAAASSQSGCRHIGERHCGRREGAPSYAYGKRWCSVEGDFAALDRHR
jgi:hypothetical protein